jgi:hypothetical protein
LVEALDFAAGLWVIGAGADVGDAELAEADMQGGASAAPGGGGEDGAVVGQYRGRGAKASERGQKGVDHLRAGHGGSGHAGQRHPRVVIDQVEDFSLGVISQAPVGDIGLPELVGLFGTEAFPG